MQMNAGKSLPPPPSLAKIMKEFSESLGWSWNLYCGSKEALQPPRSFHSTLPGRGHLPESLEAPVSPNGRAHVVLATQDPASWLPWSSSRIGTTPTSSHHRIPAPPSIWSLRSDSKPHSVVSGHWPRGVQSQGQEKAFGSQNHNLPDQILIQKEAKCHETFF